MRHTDNASFITGIRLLALLLMGVGLLSHALPAWAWDGRWTTGVSGTWPLPDKESKHSDAGLDTKPQTYYIPPNPQFVDVDPEESTDYRRKNYSPYALTRFTRDVTLGGHKLAKGYYLVKPSHFGAGSPNIHLNPPTDPNVQSANPNINGFSPSQARADSDEQPYQVFLLKQLGKVVAVVPIQETQVYIKVKGEKLPRQAIAWIELESTQEPARIVLKFLYKKKLYISHLGQV